MGPTSNAREKRPGDEVVFAGYVLLAFQNPYTIIIYCAANYSPHLCHFWSNVIYFTTFCLCIYLIKPSKTIILKRIHYIFVCVKFLDTKIFLTSNSRKFATPCSGTSPLARLLLGSTLPGTIIHTRYYLYPAIDNCQPMKH